MRKFNITLAALIFLSFSTIGFSQTEDNINQETLRESEISSTSNVVIPKGMEVVTIGSGGKRIVPKGAIVRKVGSQIIIEGSKEYMSRKFEEADARFTRIEKANDELKKEIEALKTAIKATPKSQ